MEYENRTSGEGNKRRNNQTALKQSFMEFSIRVMEFSIRVC